MLKLSQKSELVDLDRNLGILTYHGLIFSASGLLSTKAFDSFLQGERSSLYYLNRTI